MNKKELIKEYYKRNTIVHYIEGRYSKSYTEWIERRLLINENLPCGHPYDFVSQKQEMPNAGVLQCQKCNAILSD